MPTIFEKDGFRFFFYSNEHRPIHVHLRYGGGEAVFEVENQVELRESHGLKLRELSMAEKLAEENKKLIIEKWHEHLTDTAVAVAHVNGHIFIRMESGAEVRFPIAENPRLARGTPRQFNDSEISPFGLH